MKPRTDLHATRPDLVALEASAPSPRAAERAVSGDAPATTRRAGRRARFAALERLLDDDSPLVQVHVRREIERAGAAALPMLKRASRSPVPQLRSRARMILGGLQKRDSLRRLMRYLCRADVDLERALFLLGRHHDPGLDVRPYLRALDAMALEVSRRAAGKDDELDRAATLCEVLGGALDYGRSAGEFHHPDNIHMHRAIKRKAGMPLTLCAIYKCVARRVGLTVALVPLPGHVMLRLHGEDGESRIVDPYHEGQVRTEAELVDYLTQNGLSFQAEWFRDADDRAMVRRQILNLARSAEKRGLKRDAQELLRVLRVAEAPA